MDTALDLFLIVFILVIVFLVIVVGYDRARSPPHMVGPLSDGNYAIYWSPTVGGSTKGYLSYSNDTIVSEPSSDTESVSPNSIWFFQNILCSHGNNYYISQKDSSGVKQYLSSANDVSVTSIPDHRTVWKVVNIGDGHFTISNMASTDPVCLAYIGNNFTVSDYGGLGDQRLCNYSGSHTQLIVDGTRTVQIYAVQ